jgi:hypothetical protein
LFLLLQLHEIIQIFGFNVAIKRSLIWVVVVLVALGSVGMSLGLVISGAANIGMQCTVPFVLV